MNKLEIVYVLSNPAMPGLVKIGKTTQSDVTKRMNELHTTGVPVPFECEYAIEVTDCSKVESALHLAFGPNRINPKREFFKIQAEQAIAILKLLNQKDVTPSIVTELNNASTQADKDSGEKLKKRPRMNFADMNIPVGSTLTFKDGNATAIVNSDKTVLHNDKTVTLTALTREILEIDYSVQPSPHWTFEGKLLKDIYEEIYDEDFS